MTVVVGTAGHIDHGKTALLRAVTGIDADRLPEERRRGMTIDVGYAHLTLPGGASLDFVDVPGHDRLVGNMLVGAGEIDAALLVVAADDGPRAQTIEHLELLDALGIRHGVAAVTKTDVAGPERTAEVAGQVAGLLEGTSLTGCAVVAVSSVEGVGLEALLVALDEVRARIVGEGDVAVTGSRLAIDRVFAVKGRGVVVTGTLRGRPLTRGASLRVMPGARSVRIREVQVHGATVETAEPGRTALNLAGIETVELHRGLVLTDDPAVVATDRILVRMSARLPDRARGRAHLGTAATEATVSRSGRDALDLSDGSSAAILRLAVPIAAAAGDRLVLRRSSGTERIVGATVLDPEPARGISRRRQTNERVDRLATALAVGPAASVRAARLDLHGALAADGNGAGDPAALAGAGQVVVADDVRTAVGDAVLAATDPVTDLTRARAVAAVALRRRVTLDRTTAAIVAAALVDRLVDDGQLVREGTRLGRPGAAAGVPERDPVLSAAMDRLERALAVAAPPPLADAARAAACPPAGIRELEREGRIVVLEPDLAWAIPAYREIAATALALATRAPLTPAALRDATGTSRKYVMAILADLDRRGVLRRTPAGHVPGPRAPAGIQSGSPR